MIFTTEMVQLFGVALGRDAQRLTETLLREGCMQFVKTSEYENKNPEAVAADLDHLEDIVDLRKRIEGFLHTAGITASVCDNFDINSRVSVDIKKEDAFLNEISAKREGVRDKQRLIHQEILKLEDIKRQMELYGKDVSDLKLAANSSLISMQVGKLPASNLKQLEAGLKGFLSFSATVGIDGDMVHRFLISMKRDKSEINNILTKAGWVDVELPEQAGSVNKNVLEEISTKLEKLNTELAELETKAKDIIKSEVKHLQDVWVNLRASELLCKIRTNFESSSRTIVFTGWLPASKKEKLTKEIMQACGGCCHLEWKGADSKTAGNDDVPVQLKNPKFLEPFQMLVSNFGIPSYGAIDPTAFIMPIYLCMFGLMFADVGQGLVLAIAGFLSAYSLRNDQQKRGMYNLSWLISWCGLSSMVFGFLFGSFFGMSIIRPIWFDFHGIVTGHVSTEGSMIKDVYGILKVTIYFGIIVIAVGLIFNWVNIIRSRRWDELFFDKGGILGGWIYAGGTYTAFYYVSSGYKTLPDGNVLFILSALPAMLLFIKEPYHFFKHRNPDQKLGPIAVMNFLMFWVVELLEIFSGYLSNTLSFMRVAGLGIAHVCLMMSFFTLAEMTSGLSSVLILVIGNILVIVLEGLTAGIQALRLSYYEFFTKFFHGTGKLYTPISLKNNN